MGRRGGHHQQTETQGQKLHGDATSSEQSDAEPTVRSMCMHASGIVAASALYHALVPCVLTAMIAVAGERRLVVAGLVPAVGAGRLEGDVGSRGGGGLAPLPSVNRGGVIAHEGCAGARETAWMSLRVCGLDKARRVCEWSGVGLGASDPPAERPAQRSDQLGQRQVDSPHIHTRRRQRRAQTHTPHTLEPRAPELQWTAEAAHRGATSNPAREEQRSRRGQANRSSILEFTAIRDSSTNMP